MTRTPADIREAQKAECMADLTSTIREVQPCSVHEYVSEYEFRYSDGNGYTPVEHERAMLEDAIHGYLSEHDEHRTALSGEIATVPRWRCFHCDEEFTSEREARLHFGRDEGSTPACQVKGSEGGLVEALRRAEDDAAEAWHSLHDESNEAARAYQAQLDRHRQQMIAVEQVGYDRGLADARLHPKALTLTANEGGPAAQNDGPTLDAPGWGQWVPHDQAPHGSYACLSRLRVGAAVVPAWMPAQGRPSLPDAIVMPFRMPDDVARTGDAQEASR